MIKEKDIKLLYIICIGFILINAICMYREIYFFNLVPAAIVILLLAIFSLEKLMLLTVFLTPLAINLQDLDGGLGLSLPTEPIIFGIMIIFLLKQLHSASFDKNVLKHPITIAIIINLVWITFTTITSEHPIVSIKFLISRLWFVIAFYFLGTQLFKKYSNIKTFNWLYITAFIIIIIYTLYIHAGYGFDEKTANYVMSPFYNDHTVYGAMLAMFLPTIIFYSFNKKSNPSVKFVAISFLIIFIIALVFSYTRAAWLSLIVALLAYIVLLLKIKFRTILIIAGCITTVLLYYRTDIVMKLEKNRQDASKDFEKHIQSIANISTDASNLERLNRWSAAFRLFEERPILGWGPGTYSFVYAPYQHANEKTIISTNMGDRGNAHSEYIGPLCESGVLGAITFIAIVLITIGTGFKLFYAIQEHELKMTVLVILLGFITYVVHGVLNNFLDTDKASVPFWGFVAMLVAIDVYHKNKLKEN